MEKLPELQILESFDKGNSIRVIAEEFNTYPMKIQRILKKYNRKRNLKEATEISLKTGRFKGMTGKKHSVETKSKISKSALDKQEKPA
jgi:hypothetical protein